MFPTISTILFVLFTQFAPLISNAANPVQCQEAFLDRRSKKEGAKRVTDYSLSKRWQVAQTASPTTQKELSDLVAHTDLPVSVVGGGYSMGGQTVAQRGLRVDLSKINRIIEIDKENKMITVEAGATWAQIQRALDPLGLSVKIMQSYNNFSVGGSLSVNVHGRYVGYGPIISSVESIKLLMADGKIITASRNKSRALFSGAIGGYGGIGIITEVKLQLVKNSKLERSVATFSGSPRQIALGYLNYLKEQVLSDPDSVMTNLDFFPNSSTGTAITFKKTDRPLTVLENMRAQPQTRREKLVRAIAITMEQLTRKVKIWRERVLVPLNLTEEQVVMRNWEASYDVEELQSLSDMYPWMKRVIPFSNRRALLQEYFIPTHKLPDFLGEITGIFKRNKVNVSNISLRHVPANSESLLSWSHNDSIAVVVYYTQPYGFFRKQKPIRHAKEWTREVIDRCLKHGGSYYLPYQPYATKAQFERAYHRSGEFFALKRTVDPRRKFRNALIDQYQDPEKTYHFAQSISDDAHKVQLRQFFANIFTLYNPDQYVRLIESIVEDLRARKIEPTDRVVYSALLDRIQSIKPSIFKNISKSIAALRVQQNEMADQTKQALSEIGINQVRGHLVIGDLNRYTNILRQRISLSGPVYVVNDAKPGFDPQSVLERTGGYGFFDPRSYLPILRRGKFVDLSNYDPITQSDVPNESVEMASAYIGLHHAPPEKLSEFVASIYRTLKPGGVFVLRDHNYQRENAAVVQLAHRAYNAGLGVDRALEFGEIRNFQPLSYWRKVMRDAGFTDSGVEKYQQGDPTSNALLIFRKPLEQKNITDLASSIAQSASSEQELLEGLRGLPFYARPSSNTNMTGPEWFFVDVYEEYARFMLHHPWYEFPFAKFNKQMDAIYEAMRNHTLKKGLRDRKGFVNYDEMDRGLVTANRWLFRLLQLTANQIKKGLEKEEVHNKTHFVIGATKEELEKLPDGISKDMDSISDDLALATSTRYMPFTETILKLARNGVNPVDVAGSNRIMVVCTTKGENLPEGLVELSVPIFSGRFPTAEFNGAKGRSTETFHYVEIDVKKTSEFVSGADAAGVNIIRFHDF